MSPIYQLNIITGDAYEKTLLTLAALGLACTGYSQTNDTLAKAKASGTISMGVRDSSGALSYTLGDGKYAGYHVEICQRVIANVEKAVGRKLEVKYQPVTSQNRIPLLMNGTVDIECGSTTNNAARQKDVAFLPTAFVEEVRIAVRRIRPSPQLLSCMERTWPPQQDQHLYKRFAGMSGPKTSTSKRFMAETMLIPSCYLSQVAPMLL